MFTACLFEGAENERAAAVVLHVVSQVLPGNVGCAALVRTLDGKSRAVILVVLQTRERRCQNVLNGSTSYQNICYAGESLNGKLELKNRNEKQLIMQPEGTGSVDCQNI